MTEVAWLNVKPTFSSDWCRFDDAAKEPVIWTVVSPVDNDDIVTVGPGMQR